MLGVCPILLFFFSLFLLLLVRAFFVVFDRSSRCLPVSSRWVGIWPIHVKSKWPPVPDPAGEVVPISNPGADFTTYENGAKKTPKTKKNRRKVDCPRNSMALALAAGVTVGAAALGLRAAIPAYKRWQARPKETKVRRAIDSVSRLRSLEGG